MPFSVQLVILSLPRCALNLERARPQQDVSPHHLPTGAALAAQGQLPA